MSKLPVDGDQIEAYASAIFPACIGYNCFYCRAFPEHSKRGAQWSVAYGLTVPVWTSQYRRRYARHNGLPTILSQPQVFCPPLAGFIGERAREQDLLEAYTLSVECDQRPAEARKNS